MYTASCSPSYTGIFSSSRIIFIELDEQQELVAQAALSPLSHSKFMTLDQLFTVVQLSVAKPKPTFKVITLTNHNRRTQSNELIECRSKYM